MRAAGRVRVLCANYTTRFRITSWRRVRCTRMGGGSAWQQGQGSSRSAGRESRCFPLNVDRGCHCRTTGWIFRLGLVVSQRHEKQRVLLRILTYGLGIIAACIVDPVQGQHEQRNGHQGRKWSEAPKKGIHRTHTHKQLSTNHFMGVANIGNFWTNVSRQGSWREGARGGLVMWHTGITQNF